MSVTTRQKCAAEMAELREACRVSLQPFATDAGTGGRKRPQTATERESEPNETAVGREPAIM